MFPKRGDPAEKSISRALGLARTSGYFYRSGETAAAADYFLAVRTDGERNARSHILVTIWCSQVCGLHKYEAFAVTTCFTYI